MKPPVSHATLIMSTAVLMFVVPAAGLAQPADPLDPMGKLRIHSERIIGPFSLAKTAAYAGFAQVRNEPSEWGHGGAAFGKRLGSAIGNSAIREALAFGIDSTLHQDPRYFRSTSKGIWGRTGHALRGVVMTRTDSGGETVSAWRIGSAYGAAYLSNQWYPDRLNTPGLCIKQGSLQLGLDFASNLLSEFWPDVKRKLRHGKQ